MNNEGWYGVYVIETAFSGMTIETLFARRKIFHKDVQECTKSPQRVTNQKRSVFRNTGT
jgi:hypothetical protein